MIKITIPPLTQPPFRWWSGTCTGCRCEVECDDNEIDQWATGADRPTIKCPNLYCRERIELFPIAENE